MAETAQKMECSLLRGSIWSENVCGMGKALWGDVGRAPWGDVGMWLLSHSALRAVQVGRVTAQCGVKDGGLWGSHPAGDPDKAPHGSAHKHGVPAACRRLPGLHGRGGSCLEKGGDSAPQGGGPSCRSRASAESWVLLVGDFSWCPNVMSSEGSSWPRDRTHIPCISCTSRWILYHQCHLGSPSCWTNMINKQESQLNGVGRPEGGSLLPARIVEPNRKTDLLLSGPVKRHRLFIPGSPPACLPFYSIKAAAPFLCRACTSLLWLHIPRSISLWIPRSSLLEKWLLVLGQYYFDLGSVSLLC